MTPEMIDRVQDIGHNHSNRADFCKFCNKDTKLQLVN